MRGKTIAIHSQGMNPRGETGICSNDGPDYSFRHVQMFLAGAH
jgi:hypothetical protein